MSEIADRIEETGAIKRGRFTLSDGSLTDYYIDKYVFETRPDVLAAVTTELAARVDTDAIDTIVGPALGAVPLVTALSLELGVESAFVRKGDQLRGTQARIEGEIGKGQRVLVVEDVTTTGKTALETARIVEESGGLVDRILTVVDRNEGAETNVRDAGYAFEALLTVGEDLSVE